MLRFNLVETAGLFDGSTSRGMSERGLLWWLEMLAHWNYLYLTEHPETAKLYDSGVVYDLPEQMKKPVSAKTITAVMRLLDDDGVDGDTKAGVNAILKGCERFRDVAALYQKGSGDCDNVAAVRVAELRLAGVKASPGVTSRKRPDGGTTYHALVRWPDGTSEDPSLILGMGGPERATERSEEVRKNKERYVNMLEAARVMCGAGSMSIADAGKRIDAMGLLPKAKGMDWR